MCIKDYETKIGGQGPVRAVEIVKKNNAVSQNERLTLGIDHS
jgi:hypothetical protein